MNDKVGKEYIAANMLTEIPSVGDRYRAHIEKGKSKSKSRGKSSKTQDDEIVWDFSGTEKTPMKKK